MTWTYTQNPSGVSRDAVRLMIGDTDTNDQQLQDEELAWFIALQPGDLFEAAARASDTLAAKYARLSDKSVGPISIQFSNKATAYRDLASSLREQKSSATRYAAPEVPGIYVTERDILSSDGNLVQPYFKTGDMDNVGANPV